MGPPPFGAPTLRGLTLLPEGVNSSMHYFHLVVLFFFEEGQNTETLKLAKVGLAKVGHPNLGQSRSIKVGQSRSNFLAKVGLPKVGQIRMAKVGLAKVDLSRDTTRSAPHAGCH